MNQLDPLEELELFELLELLLVLLADVPLLVELPEVVEDCAWVEGVWFVKPHAVRNTPSAAAARLARSVRRVRVRSGPRPAAIGARRGGATGTPAVARVISPRGCATQLRM